MMSTMGLEDRRTDAPPSVTRCLRSSSRWVISLASLLVASCGHFDITHPPGDTPQDAPEPRDAANDAPVDVAVDVPVDAQPVCDLTGLVCPEPATAIKLVYDWQCWARCGAMESAIDAQHACEGWSGELGEIKTQADQDWVTSQLVDRTWLGLHQQDNEPTVTDGWTWNSSPDVPPLVRWADKQPDDGGGFIENNKEQCMNVDTDGGWHDAPCSGELHPFLCRQR